MADERMRGDREGSVSRAVLRLQDAIDLLNSRAWRDADEAAVQAELLAEQSSRTERRIRWLTIATLINLAPEDGAQYLCFPVWPVPDDMRDLLP